MDNTMEYKGTFNVRISPERYKRAEMAAMSRKMSLNNFAENSINKTST